METRGCEESSGERETLCEHTQGVMPGLDQKGMCIYFISRALESIERIQLGLMESQSGGE